MLGAVFRFGRIDLHATHRIRDGCCTAGLSRVCAATVARLMMGAHGSSENDGVDRSTDVRRGRQSPCFA